MMSENDNQKPPVILDEHRGMAAQKATNIRRHESDVRADQESLRLGQSELEKNLFAGPATNWQQAADKAAYLLRLLAATAEGQDPRNKKLIEDVIGDFHNLISGSSER
jgi:hypothetical protein